MASAAILLRAVAAAPARRLALEWYGAPFHAIALRAGRPRGPGGRIREFRPADPGAGGRLLAGAFSFGGETLSFGPGGDPWNRPCPSQRLAGALHAFGWLPDLLACGQAGADEALRLTLAWRRMFGRWNGFAWDGEILRRRTIALAAGLAPMTAVASDAEGALLALDLSRQARHLLALGGDIARAAERAAAATIAACALGGPGPARLRERALRRLEGRLPDAVLADGVHASGSPLATLELLFDLLTLDDALTQLGRPPPAELSRAIDRLTGAVRFFTLPDGRLASLQGGADVVAPRIAAALAHDDASRSIPNVTRDSAYYRLDCPDLTVLAHAGAAARGPWSTTACAQPAAIEIVAGGRRLFTGCAWSPGAPPHLRLSDAGACPTLDGHSPGAPLTGFAAWALGPRLDGPRWRSVPRRSEGDNVVLLEVSHDAWMDRLGIRVERRLYLDGGAAELRGEERFIPTVALRGERRRFVPFAVRLHLCPGVRAQVALDGKSVLIRHGSEEGWWLRTDAADVSLAPSQRLVDGEMRGAEQIVLAGRFRLEAGGRVRWKLGRG